ATELELSLCGQIDATQSLIKIATSVLQLLHTQFNISRRLDPMAVSLAYNEQRSAMIREWLRDNHGLDTSSEILPCDVIATRSTIPSDAVLNSPLRPTSALTF